MSAVKKIFRFLALILFIIILASLLRDILFGQFSLQENKKLETLIEKKEDELINISEKNEMLKDEIRLLKNNEEYVEHIARENLGLIREGEEYIDEEPD
ncbi:MAG: cell division protein FtsB [Gammaproteobacteria bacterium TMED112]|nr:MAG: cell division protein FtsB [Gammaproteobacteria bacterium TMED112]|tara:strand:- start:1127 stop:1423 length:297 start_codon:yes stop_codon:yes gene_type:complete